MVRVQGDVPRDDGRRDRVGTSGVSRDYDDFGNLRLLRYYERGLRLGSRGLPKVRSEGLGGAKDVIFEQISLHKSYDSVRTMYTSGSGMGTERSGSLIFRYGDGWEDTAGFGVCTRRAFRLRLLWMGDSRGYSSQG
jgi:hypothetical protein